MSFFDFLCLSEAIYPIGELTLTALPYPIAGFKGIASRKDKGKRTRDVVEGGRKGGEKWDVRREGKERLGCWRDRRSWF